MITYEKKLLQHNVKRIFFFFIQLQLRSFKFIFSLSRFENKTTTLQLHHLVCVKIQSSAYVRGVANHVVVT